MDVLLAQEVRLEYAWLVSIHALNAQQDLISVQLATNLMELSICTDLAASDSALLVTTLMRLLRGAKAAQLAAPLVR